MTLALIAKYTDLAEKDAEKIAKEIEQSVQPSTYPMAKELVNKIATGAKNSKK
jgi:hypothetical protein